MRGPDSGYPARYAAALGDFLAGGGESALERAHELGREALAAELGILDMVAIHLEAALEVQPHGEDPLTGKARAAALQAFLYESLGPFEMTHRGFRDAVRTLRRLNETMEAEGKRLAHTLHDETSQYLASACVALELVGRDLPPTARPRLDRAREALNQAVDSIRRISHELRPTILDDLGLIPAVEVLAEGVAARTDLRVTVEGSTRGRLPGPVETALYRITQEALANAIRHAGCTGVNIRFGRENGDVLCSIRDDGRGFDAAGVVARRARHGLGILVMRERVASLGGTMEIQSRTGQGTELRLRVSVEDQNAPTNLARG